MDSGWLIVQDGLTAVPGAVSIGVPVGHMQNEWNGYTFGAAGPAVGDREGGPAGRRCRGQFLARL